MGSDRELLFETERFGAPLETVLTAQDLQRQVFSLIGDERAQPYKGAMPVFTFDATSYPHALVFRF